MVQRDIQNFQFVLKAYQGMTGHQREDLPFETRNDMFNAFIECANCFQTYGKLAMVLVQFPPWFDCSGEKCTIYSLYKTTIGAFSNRHRISQSNMVR